MTQPKHWLSKNLSATCLLPFSMLYRLGLKVHQDYRLARRWHAPVPVISVGNITVGGTGKTPMVKKIALSLAEQGQQVAIVTRGYKAKWAGPYKVLGHETAVQVGDEPLTLHQNCGHTTVSIWIGKDRKATAKRAVQAGATVLVLDDGFQSTHISRDVDLVLAANTKEPFGNTYLLPAGPLREPTAKLERASAVVYVGKNHDGPEQKIPTYYLSRTLDADRIGKGKVIAFAGIGAPQQFFDGLSATGANIIETYAFPDHHTYSQKDVESLTAEAEKHNAKLVCTQKDWVKLPKNVQDITQPVPLALSGVDWIKIERLIHAVIS